MNAGFTEPQSLPALPGEVEAVEVEVLPPHKHGAANKASNTKPSKKSPRKIKPIEEDEDFLDDLEESDAELDDEDFDFDDDDLEEDE